MAQDGDEKASCQTDSDYVGGDLVDGCHGWMDSVLDQYGRAIRRGLTKQMDLKDVFVPYDSPIDVIFNRAVDNIMTVFNNSIDDGVVECVVKAGFNVDKDKLVEVFTQDKRRYEEAYRKGYAQREADIIQCKDCACSEPTRVTPTGKPLWCHLHDMECTNGYYCADGIRKDGDEE